MPDKKSVMAKPVRKAGGRMDKRDPATFIENTSQCFACSNMQCAAIAGDLPLFCYKHKNSMRQPRRHHQHAFRSGLRGAAKGSLYRSAPCADRLVIALI
jgi:hypothetical protein